MRKKSLFIIEISYLLRIEGNWKFLPQFIPKCTQIKTVLFPFGAIFKLFFFFRVYYAEDDEYKYKIAICQINPLETTAVQQMGKKWKPGTAWLPVGRYFRVQVTGGSK